MRPSLIPRDPAVMSPTGRPSYASLPSRPNGAPKFCTRESSILCSVPPPNLDYRYPHVNYNAYYNVTTHGPQRPASIYPSTRNWTLRHHPRMMLCVHSREPPGKSPRGQTAYPRDLLSILSATTFATVHACISLCYQTGDIPLPWLVSETLCLYKGKGSWQAPDSRRPIAMSNSIYRLLMRLVYCTLYPLLSPLLHPRQFSGRQGTSPAHGTQTFLYDIDHLDNIEAILAFDVHHAFDSLPKALISMALQWFGTPLRLLRLISLALEYGATYIRGCPESVFRTTHSVDQGCPLLCFLSVIVSEIPLRYLNVRGIPFSAYVDDISSPALRGRSQHVSTTVQEALALMRCQLNIKKSDALPALPPPYPPCPNIIIPRRPYRHQPALRGSVNRVLTYRRGQIPRYTASPQPSI